MSLRDILGLAEGKSKSQHPLWTLLGPASRPVALSTPSRVTPTIHPISSKDKTATSLRLLLCDAQNTLESFSTQIHGLVKDVGRSNLQLEETTKVLENGQAMSTGDLKVLRKLGPCFLRLPRTSGILCDPLRATYMNTCSLKNSDNCGQIARSNKLLDTTT